MYGTAQMATKAVLAIYFHFKWMVTDCRCWTQKPMFEDRLEYVNQFWRKTNEDYLTTAIKSQ